MADEKLAVPTDIPWQRIAFSRDMMDKVACDRELPLRWRSSVAVFEYAPPADQQRLEDFKITYLKVACSITGYQPDDKEIRIRERLGRSGWTSKKLPEINLVDAIDHYYACYGAMLEVVVAPPADENVKFEDYPYFADFDPKKRELYELVTKTGEVMSRTLEEVNVRQGQTTLQSHEVRDKTTVSADASGTIGVLSASGSVSNESGTTDLTQRSTENVRTTDALQENRESLSHTTQLSQMYHQLNSYHLGTNRAAFFVSPRPHVVQSTDPDGPPRTFVDGPRQLEGIQEFMLVVVRPKSQEKICVEAYLETAHLVPKENRDEDADSRLWEFTEIGLLPGEGTEFPGGPHGMDYHKTFSQTFTPPPGYIVDLSRGDIGSPGVHILTATPTGKGAVLPLVWETATDHVTLSVELVAKFRHPLFSDTPYASISYKLTALIFIKKKKAEVAMGFDDTLLITGRGVCSCAIDVRAGLTDVSIVFEKKLALEPVHQLGRAGEAMTIQDANRASANIQRETFQSLSSADRYPRGLVSLLDSQLIAGKLATHLRGADRDLNPRLAVWAGVDAHTRQRVTAYAPAITRGQLLAMPLTQQVERFGLSFAEAVELRRSLADLKEPTGPPPVPEPQKIPVPMITGLPLDEARTVVSSAGLLLGTVTEVESHLPSGAVVEQEPAAGVTVGSETEVSVKLASGLSVRLPEVIGLGLTEAACRLRNGGLRSEPTIEGPLGPDAKVVELEPPAGTLVTPKSSVTLRLRKSRGRNPGRN